MIAAVALAGCVGPPGDLTGLDRAELSDDGRIVHLIVVGPPPMADNEPCGAGYTAQADIRESTLYVAVRQTAERTGHCQLDRLVCCRHTIDVELPPGAAVSAVHDEGHPRNPVLFLTRPLGLAEPIGLPDGWVIHREFASWGGTWQRIYAPPEAPPDEVVDAVTWVELGVTFGGEIITEPEALQPPVQINGAPAQYQRYADNPPGSDEIQLQWLADGRKYWLGAFDPPLTIDDVIRLAESV